MYILRYHAFLRHITVAENCVLRSGTKSDFLECMESSISSTRIKPMVNGEVLDGSVLVHMLMPSKCETFDYYPEKVFLSRMLEKLESKDRLDIIWYRYLPQSLQQATKQKKEAAVVCKLHQFLQIVLETGTK